MNLDVRSEIEQVAADFDTISEGDSNTTAKEIQFWRRIANTPSETVAQRSIALATERSLLALTTKNWTDQQRESFLNSESRSIRHTVWWTNPVTQQPMVFIPPGKYLLTDRFSKGLQPIHRPGFSMARYPVTNEQFQSFVTQTNYKPKHNGDEQLGYFLQHFNNHECPKELFEHPVTWVNFFDAVEYCRWAGCQLPDQSQWQQASRGKDGRKYAWGNTDIFSISDKQTKPVGKLTRFGSPFGCEDMNGNVSHWCEPIHQKANPPNQHIVVGACYHRQSSRTATPNHTRWLNSERRNGWVGFRICS